MDLTELDIYTVGKYIHCYYVMEHNIFDVKLVSALRDITTNQALFTITFNQYYSDNTEIAMSQPVTNILTEKDVISIINYITRTHTIVGDIQEYKLGSIVNFNNKIFNQIDGMKVCFVPTENSVKTLQLK